MDRKSKLYSKAKMNNLNPPYVKAKIIKTNFITNNNNGVIASSALVLNSIMEQDAKNNSNNNIHGKQQINLPFIKQRPESSKLAPKQLSTNMKTNFNNVNGINSINKTNIAKLIKPNNPYLQPYKTKKSFKPYLKDNLWYTIILFLPSKSLFNFMLVSKQFFRLASKCDELWYIYYIKKFKPVNLEYHIHHSKWRTIFLSDSKKIHKTNYDSLTKKFLSKYKKNNYVAKKDHYYLSNNLFTFLKPKYSFEIDGSLFPVRHILTNKLLSHINFYTNFNEEYQDMNKASKLRLLMNDQNMGFYSKVIAEYNLKKIRFNCTESDGLQSKICKVFYNDNLIISTFEKTYIFFINISLPICRICETLFDFLKGIHSLHLNYFCDSDSKFGLYDYSLLINLKSWNCVYYSLSVTTCDFKEDGDELYYINETTIANHSPVRFDIKTICMNDFIERFLIFDLVLLSYQGDHVLCESKPLIIKDDSERIDYDEYGSSHSYAEIIDARFKMRFNFNSNTELSYYALVYTELRIGKAFIETIFKKN